LSRTVGKIGEQDFFVIRQMRDRRRYLDRFDLDRLRRGFGFYNVGVFRIAARPDA
jgi:hypothetical protein